MSDDSDYMLALMLHKQLNSDQAENNTAASADVNKESDYEMALKMQALLNSESESEGGGATDLDTSIQFVYPKSKPMENKKTTRVGPAASQKEPRRAIQDSHDDYLNQTMNLVHPQWELVDPNPDIFSMFVRFDDKFFQKRLGAVALEWSKRMYSCAGICYQRGNRHFKEIIIRLSEPLLKLRPRKDLVETMLHEMIHAYCFVLNIREGNGGHGPNFKRIMETINKVAGTNITVYHSFHDEVAAYRTHIWRCTGICQNRTPFQGYVKRTSNRAPGPNDQWWEKHQRECGGTFMKIGEPSKPVKPEGKPKAKKPAPPLAAPKDGIRNWLSKPAAKKQATEAALLGNLVSAVPPTSYPGPSTDPFTIPKPPAAAKPRGANVKSFGDLNKSNQEEEPPSSGLKTTTEMTGHGYSIGGSNSKDVIDITNDSPDPSVLRKMRLERFGGVDSTKEQDKPEVKTGNKRRRMSNEDNIVSWESWDDDLMIRGVEVPVIDLVDSDEDNDGQPAETKVSIIPGGRNTMSSHERTLCIKREIMEDESTYSEGDIEFIDDEYDDEVAANNDSLTAATELADQSIIDDLFGEDTLLKEFQRENAVQPSCSKYSSNIDNDIVSCPICFEKMKRTQLANHFEGCTITVRIEPPSVKSKFSRPSSTDTSKGSKAKSKNISSKQILRNVGYTDKEIDELNLSSSSDSPTVLSSEDELTPRQRRQRNLYKQTISCFNCGQELMGHQMEAHRSLCKKKSKR
ncbi:DNA-dependent metalloprotease SPRTN [Drosophila eugracilis]|uniref:DNA-dependent metalloprotease SPRTN n=1 Tax=Drosophila eugracilis TaxID=29029 RepID=UPI001BD95874|nr:DNA-dependent metalloprotease SPRTN [Drosophila eugracilis]